MIRFLVPRKESGLPSFSLIVWVATKFSDTKARSLDFCWLLFGLSSYCLHHLAHDRSCWELVVFQNLNFLSWAAVEYSHGQLPCRQKPSRWGWDQYKLDANVSSGLLYCAGDTIRSNNNWCAVLYYLHDVCPY